MVVSLAVPSRRAHFTHSTSSRLSTASPIPGHQTPMEPTDNCSRSGDYGCPAAGFFNQLEQEEDPMSFLLSQPQSPQPPSLWLSENSGDMQISPLDEMPCTPAADVPEETNYAAASAPLVATHGTGSGQFSSNFSLSSTTSDQFEEEEVQQKMESWLHLLVSPRAPDGLSNTAIYGGPAARSHADADADAVLPLVQQGTSTTTADELPHPQQQLPQQQMMPTILPPQPPSLTPVINPGPGEASHAASAPMTSQETTLIPAVPQDHHQEANMLSRASTQRRPIERRGLPSRSRLQDGSAGELFRMGIDMICQFGRHIGKMMKEEKQRLIVLQHFWRSECNYCGTFTLICQYCYTVMRYHPSGIQLLRHLQSCECYNNSHLLPASSGAPKETQRRSSQALQIKEIAENPNGESEPIETDNSNNCAAAARVDTQDTNAVVLSPCQQHQLPMDHKEQMATILSSQPCCQVPNCSWTVVLTPEDARDEPESWWSLMVRLSDSLCFSSTTKSTHDGFRLKFSNDKKPGFKTVHMHSSVAWVHVSENPPYNAHAEVSLKTVSCPNGRPFLWVVLNSRGASNWKSAPAGWSYPWEYLHTVLCSIGFKKQFATNLVIYALGWVDACNLSLMSPRSSNREQGDDDVPSGKRKREPARTPSKVWNHFTKEVVEAEDGSMVTMAKCNHCGSKLKADSARHGTTQLGRHIRAKHPEHAESS